MIQQHVQVIEASLVLHVLPKTGVEPLDLVANCSSEHLVECGPLLVGEVDVIQLGDQALNLAFGEPLFCHNYLPLYLSITRDAPRH